MNSRDPIGAARRGRPSRTPWPKWPPKTSTDLAKALAHMKTPRNLLRGVSVSVVFQRSAAVGQNGQQQQGHDVGDLDHRVHGRTRGVLVGVADSVAGDGCLV